MILLIYIILTLPISICDFLPFFVDRKVLDVKYHFEYCNDHHSTGTIFQCFCKPEYNTVMSSQNAPGTNCRSPSEVGCEYSLLRQDETYLVTNNSVNVYEKIVPSYPYRNAFIKEILIWNENVKWQNITLKTVPYFSLSYDVSHEEQYLTFKHLNFNIWKGHVIKILFGTSRETSCLTMKFQGPKYYPFNVEKFKEQILLPKTKVRTSSIDVSSTSATATRFGSITTSKSFKEVSSSLSARSSQKIDPSKTFSVLMETSKKTSTFKLKISLSTVESFPETTSHSKEVHQLYSTTHPLFSHSTFVTSSPSYSHTHKTQPSRGKPTKAISVVTTSRSSFSIRTNASVTTTGFATKSVSKSIQSSIMLTDFRSLHFSSSYKASLAESAIYSTLPLSATVILSSLKAHQKLQTSIDVSLSSSYDVKHNATGYFSFLGTSINSDYRESVIEAKTDTTIRVEKSFFSRSAFLPSISFSSDYPPVESTLKEYTTKTQEHIKHRDTSLSTHPTLSSSAPLLETTVTNSTPSSSTPLLEATVTNSTCTEKQMKDTSVFTAIDSTKTSSFHHFTAEKTSLKLSSSYSPVKTLWSSIRQITCAPSVTEKSSFFPLQSTVNSSFYLRASSSLELSSALLPSQSQIIYASTRLKSYTKYKNGSVMTKIYSEIESFSRLNVTSVSSYILTTNSKKEPSVLLTENMTIISSSTTKPFSSSINVSSTKKIRHTSLMIHTEHVRSSPIKLVNESSSLKAIKTSERVSKMRYSYAFSSSVLNTSLESFKTLYTSVFQSRFEPKQTTTKVVSFTKSTNSTRESIRLDVNVPRWKVFSFGIASIVLLSLIFTLFVFLIFRRRRCRTVTITPITAFEMKTMQKDWSRKC